MLIIGDGSGSSPTGTGAMTVTRVAFDNDAQTIAAAVPEPATWSLLLAGFAAVGVASRQARSGAARITRRG